jgi:internalin A
MPDPDMTALEQKACAEALRRIGECGRRRATALDLCGLKLTRLPPQLAQLSKLTELNLSDNQLRGLPPEVIQLANLTRLDLSDNQLDCLPPELAQLTGLTLLDLSNNQLGALPPQLGQLTNLTRLDLSNNKLASVPPQLGQLANLTRLDVSDNQLAAVPPELGGLANLTRLYLSNNRLEALPPELGRLASLTRLYASSNKLGGVPAELGALAKLTVLDLSNNQLASLPPELGGLARLTVLDLSNNKLAALPAQLGELATLAELDLSNNPLAALPESLRELASLERLMLHDNPALQLSPSVLGPDPRKTQAPRLAAAKAILDFYFGRQSGTTRPLNEVKLILLGRSGAGKTSVVQALRDLPFREREASTPGVALCEWTMDGSGEPPVTAHVWDFSGHEICHALHPFFFSRRSLYVVVLSGLDNRAQGDAEYWLRVIEEHATDEHGQGPPVVVALNQWNVPNCRPQVNRIALRERYPFIRGFVEMDCKAKKGLPALKAALCRELERMPWVWEPFPREWDGVRRALAAKGAQREVLSHDAYLALCVEQGVTDEGQQDYLAEILHHLGASLNYRHDPRLLHAAVLQPEWLTKHAYALVRRAEKQAGVLKQLDVELILRAENDEVTLAGLMQILECFQIARPLQSSAGGVWLVSHAMPHSAPAGMEGFRNSDDASRLRYTYPSLPDDLIGRLIARRYDFIEELHGIKQLWCDGLILARKGARASIRIEAQGRQCVLSVIGPTKTRRQLADLCQAEMHDLHAATPDVHPIEEIQVDGTWEHVEH